MHTTIKSVVLLCLVNVIFLVSCDSYHGPDGSQTIVGRYRSGMMAIDLQSNGTYSVISLEPNTDGIPASELMQKNLEDLPTKDKVEETGTYTTDGKWITFSGHYLDFLDHRISIHGTDLSAYSPGKGAEVIYSKQENNH